MTQARDLADGKFDTNTLVVDAANNHVGVGTASPSLPLHINGASAGDGLVYSRSGTEYFRIDDTGTDMNIKTTGGGHQVIFTTNGSEVGRWRNGGGLTFNGDTAAANAIDDYEEGTWTVTDASGAGLSLNQNTTQRYVKVGRHVFVHFYVTYPATSDTSGARLGGLPYSSENYSYFDGRVLSHAANNCVLQVSGTEMQIHYNNSTRTNANLSNAYVLISGSYIATS